MKLSTDRTASTLATVTIVQRSFIEGGGHCRNIPGGRVKGVHGGIDSSLGHRSGEHSGGVQVSEGGGRGGVSQVVSGHVDGLNNEVNYGENKKMRD